MAFRIIGISRFAADRDGHGIGQATISFSFLILFGRLTQGDYTEKK